MKIYWHFILLILSIILVYGIGAPFLTTQNSWITFGLGIILLVVFPPILWLLVKIIYNDFKPLIKETKNEKD